MDQASSSGTKKTLKLADFLATMPPSSTAKIALPVKGDADKYELVSPVLQLFCEQPECDDVTNFDCVNPFPEQIKQKEPNDIYLTYRCRHCRKSKKVYALRIAAQIVYSSAPATVYKYGENPAFGPSTPSKLRTLLGANGDLYFKGRRCESQSLGIGAHAYYRRVVENQKNKFIEEVRKVAETEGASTAVLETLTKALSETQFDKAMRLLGDAVPQSLFVAGQNPLRLLHALLNPY